MSAMDHIQTEVLEQIAKITQRSRMLIPPDALLSDFELDSLGIARLVAHIEHVLQLEFPQEHLVWFYEVNTVGELIQAVQRSYQLSLPRA